MDLYLDKDNLLSLIHSKDNEEYQDVYEDCMRMVKRQLCLRCSFPNPLASQPNNIEEKKDKMILEAFFSQKCSGQGDVPKTKFEEDVFPQRPLKSNCYNSFRGDKRSSGFFVCDDKVAAVKNKGGIMISQKGDEIDSLRRLFCGKDYDYHQLYNIQENFQSWSRIYDDGHALPITDIIILDRYLGNNENEMDYNLYEIIRCLVSNCKDEVNVVIVTKRDPDKKDYVIDWDGIRRRIKSILKKVTGVTGNVTICFTSKSKEIKNLHDRTIFTNYRLFRSGDSFSYFDSKGGLITNGMSLDVDSLAKYDNYKYAMTFIGYVQEICDYARTYHLIFEGSDMKSNYLTFE